MPEGSYSYNIDKHHTYSLFRTSEPYDGNYSDAESDSVVDKFR